MTTAKRFQRTRESFTCGNCRRDVAGDGYTNHCPACLYSRHVDVQPGDRRADCGGLMAPVGLDTTGGRFVITHRCQTCGAERRNRAADADHRAALIALSQRGPV